jgi:hypothetical protein
MDCNEYILVCIYFGIAKQDIKREFDELEIESKKLFEQYLGLQEKLASLKKIRRADMGCECDSNHCNTVRGDAPISAGDTHSFCHDDQDIGRVNAKCNTGEIEVITSAAVFYTYEELDRATLFPGQEYFYRIREQDSWNDQTNRVQIIGKGSPQSKYNLDFHS